MGRARLAHHAANRPEHRVLEMPRPNEDGRWETTTLRSPTRSVRLHEAEGFATDVRMRLKQTQKGVQKIHTYIHTCIHTYHYITLHYIALHYIHT